MPYPHKNADGKAIFGKDEEGKPKPPPKLKFPEKVKFKGAPVWFDEEPFPIHGLPPGHIKEYAEITKLLNHGLITKEQFDNHMKQFMPGYNPQPEVLIPAIEKKNYAGMWTGSIATSSPIPQQLRTTFYLDIPGLPSSANKMSFAQALVPTLDYTEPMLRQMLMEMFSRATDIIIEKMKEEKAK